MPSPHSARVVVGVHPRVRLARHLITLGYWCSHVARSTHGPQDEGLQAPNTSWWVCDVMRRCMLHDPPAELEGPCAALLIWQMQHHRRIHSAQFSLLGGGGHIRPHVGSTNRRLVMHFTLPQSSQYSVACDEAAGRRAEADAALRVGSRWRRFIGGRCVAFDDSFEHEVVHPGQACRANLVLQLSHPDLL